MYELFLNTFVNSEIFAEFITLLIFSGLFIYAAYFLNLLFDIKVVNWIFINPFDGLIEKFKGITSKKAWWILFAIPFVTMIALFLVNPKKLFESIFRSIPFIDLFSSLNFDMIEFGKAMRVATDYANGINLSLDLARLTSSSFISWISIIIVGIYRNLLMDSDNKSGKTKSREIASILPSVFMLISTNYVLNLLFDNFGYDWLSANLGGDVTFLHVFCWILCVYCEISFFCNLAKNFPGYLLLAIPSYLATVGYGALIAPYDIWKISDDWNAFLTVVVILVSGILIHWLSILLDGFIETVFHKIREADHKIKERVKEYNINHGTKMKTVKKNSIWGLIISISVNMFIFYFFEANFIAGCIICSIHALGFFALEVTALCDKYQRKILVIPALMISTIWLIGGLVISISCMP